MYFETEEAQQILTNKCEVSISNLELGIGYPERRFMAFVNLFKQLAR